MIEITITKAESKLLLLLKVNNSLQFDTVKTKISKDEFDSAAITLNEKKYIDAIFDLQKHCINVTLNLRGKAYLQVNPKAKNPFFTKKKISIIGIGVTIIFGILAIIFK